MKVLIVGGGGREHALAWKVAQSPRVETVFVAPGNAGTALEPKTHNIAVGAEDINGLLGFAREQHIDLTIVGPEAPLVAGIVDTFTAAGLRCFGPTQAAAQLEGSKAFCKDFLQRHGIPTAQYQTFTEIEPALAYIRQRGTPVVVKADGLAAGKGVIIAHSEAEAEAAVHNMLTDQLFGEAGRRIVIEELLSGEEASFIALVDGEYILPMASSQDHKARDNDDMGPNTGGMGAYSPAPIITSAMHQRIVQEVIQPTVRGMIDDGHSYCGFLYAGLMIDSARVPRVLEYNCRFGDPETQPILLRLKSDLVDLIDAALDKQLGHTEAVWDQRVALGVVMVAGGYPGDYVKGTAIKGLASIDTADVKVFHAGTARRGNNIVTNGGRVLCVTALGANVHEAQRRAYAQVDRIRWDNAYYRTDIGYRAVARELSSQS